MAINLFASPDHWEYNQGLPWDPVWVAPTPWWNDAEQRWEMLNTDGYQSNTLYQMRASTSEPDSWMEGTLTLIESAYPEGSQPVKAMWYDEADINNPIFEQLLELNTPVDFLFDIDPGVTYIFAIAPAEDSGPTLVYNISLMIEPPAVTTTTTTTTTTLPPVVLEVCLTVTDSANNTGSECVDLPACAPPTTTTTTTIPPVSLPWVFVATSSSGGG